MLTKKTTRSPMPLNRCVRSRLFVATSVPAPPLSAIHCPPLNTGDIGRTNLLLTNSQAVSARQLCRPVHPPKSVLLPGGLGRSIALLALTAIILYPPTDPRIGPDERTLPVVLGTVATVRSVGSHEYAYLIPGCQFETHERPNHVRC